MFYYMLQVLCDLTTPRSNFLTIANQSATGFSVWQQVTTDYQGRTSQQSVWVYLMTSARLDATNQFPCREPVDNKLADNWSLCMKTVTGNRPMSMKLAAIHVHSINCREASVCVRSTTRL